VKPAEVFKALANERRLLILEWLKDPRAHFPPQRDGDLVADGVCGIFIAEKLHVTQPTLSEHMKILIQAGLVNGKLVGLPCCNSCLIDVYDHKPVFIVAHDMGTSVATELMARDLEGTLEMEVTGALLLNGSMIQDAASPTLGQRLLRSAVGPLFSRLSSERFFRQQFGSIFSQDHPLTDEEAKDQWALVCAGGGRTIAHKTIRYMEERFRHAERWHGALTDWPRPLSLAWGMLDPVATERVLDAVLELRPAAALTRYDELGHYPQIEDPGRVADALRRALNA